MSKLLARRVLGSRALGPRTRGRGYARPVVAEPLERRRLFATTLYGEVLLDANYDDRYSPGIDQPLVGWQAYLDSNHNHRLDAGEPTATSGTDGLYYFYNLPAGTYDLREVVPSGYIQVHADIDLGTTVVPIPDTPPYLMYCDILNQLAHRPVGGITGTVFDDGNANGVRDPGELSLRGWTVYVDRGGDGVRDPSDPISTTGSLGHFQFSNLAPGTYKVREVPPAGWQPVGVGGDVRTVTVVADQDAAGQDFANHVTPANAGAVAGTLFADLDGDGARGPTERPLVGWRVFLDRGNDGKQDAGDPVATTDGQGAYALAGLTPGQFVLTTVVPAGYRATKPTGGRTWVTLAAGKTTTQDFGARPDSTSGGSGGSTGGGGSEGSTPGGGIPTGGTATVRGTTFDDADGDGERSADELSLAGRTIFFDADNDGQVDAGEPTAVSNAVGAWAFEGLTTGVYHVRQAVPAGWAASAPTAGAFDVTVAAGQTAEGYAFGSKLTTGGTGTDPSTGEPTPTPAPTPTPTPTPTDPVIGTPSPTPTPTSTPTPVPPADAAFGKVAGRVFDDANLDGVAAAGEVGVKGAKVFLDLNGNGRPDRGEPRRKTSADGAYAFDGLPPAAYVVRQMPAKGFRIVPPAVANAVATGASTSVVATALAAGDTAAPAPVLVSAGATTAVDLAQTRMAVLAGRAYADADGNRKPGPAEAGLAGVTVFLDADRDGLAGPGEPSAVTDADGRYALLVPAGPGGKPTAYRLTETPPTGWQAERPPTAVKVPSGKVLARDLGNRPSAAGMAIAATTEAANSNDPIHRLIDDLN